MSRKIERNKQVALRMTESELEKLDELLDELQQLEAYSGIRLTRSDVLRILVRKGRQALND